MCFLVVVSGLTETHSAAGKAAKVSQKAAGSNEAAVASKWQGGIGKKRK